MNHSQETRVYYYAITLPDGQPATFIGGPLRDARRKWVWLTEPDGTPVLRLRRRHVHPLTLEEAAARIAAQAAALRQLQFAQN